MKLTEALQQIFPATAFPDNDISAVLTASALKDIDLPDDLMTKFNGHYMTPDRAVNDPEIGKKLKAKYWGFLADEIERKLKNIVATLPDDYQTKYYAIPDGKTNGIYDRIEVVREGVAHLNEKGSGQDVKTATEKFNKIIKGLHETITTHEATIKAKEEDFAAKETGIKINYALRSKLTGFLPKLDANLLKTDVQKNFLIDSTIHSLQNEFLLEFDKDNPSAINFLKKDRTDVYEGNTKITLDKYIEKQLEPFTVKNNGAPDNAASASAAKKVEIPNGKPQTAKEIRFAAAGVTV